MMGISKKGDCQVTLIESKRLEGKGTASSSGQPAKHDKFHGQSAEDIIAKVGWPETAAKLQDLKKNMLKDKTLSTGLLGDDYHALLETIRSLRLRPSAVNRAVVSMGIKVKKWKFVPEVAATQSVNDGSSPNVGVVWVWLSSLDV